MHSTIALLSRSAGPAANLRPPATSLLPSGGSLRWKTHSSNHLYLQRNFHVRGRHLAMSNTGDFSNSQRCTDDEEVAALMDEFHAAAARSDLEAYMACFAEGGRFLGTDASENWSVEEFRKYAEPAFAAGKGWKYAPAGRSINFLPGGSFACLDERLTSSRWGVARGTGALQRSSEGKWRVVQYHLSFDVPNAVAEEVTQITSRHHRSTAESANEMGAA